MSQNTPVDSNYDSTPFVSYPSPERTPERLWWIATARGMTPAAVASARVLEIGCSTGDHLLSIAELAPQMECVGVDPSVKQIATAKSLAKKSGCKNVTFYADRVQKILGEVGTFDYIICHGVFSWISAKEQQELLGLIPKLLKEQGVCYLSHNTLPGWGVRKTLCQLLQRVDDQDAPEELRASRARAYLNLLDERLVDAHRPYGMQLQEEVKRNIQRSDAFFIHELLAPDASAHWLSDLLREASDVSLQYLGDAQPQRAQALSSEIEPLNAELPDFLFPENQSKTESLAPFYDALYPASFRASLFVHDNIELQDSYLPQALEGSFIASPLVCEVVTEAELQSTEMLPFYGPSEEVYEPKAPFVKHTLFELSEVWPAALSCTKLLVERSEKLEGEREQFLAELIKLYQRNLIEVYPASGDICSTLPVKPLVTPFRRLRAAEDWTVTLKGELFKTDPLDKVLIPLLDGTRDSETLTSEIKALVDSKQLSMQVDGELRSPDATQAKTLKNDISTAISEKLALYLERGLFFEDTSLQEPHPINSDSQGINILQKAYERFKRK